MRSNTSLPILLALVLTISSCEMLEPELDNHSTLDRVYKDPAYAEGLLLKAYSLIPTNDYLYDEVATDDAVTNDRLSSFLRLATGEWSATYNPENLWEDCNEAILYLNQFLTVVEEVEWNWTTQELNDLYIRRLKGESLALRGMFKYFLMRNHAGYGTGGELLGIPIYNEFIEDQDRKSVV